MKQRARTFSFPWGSGYVVEQAHAPGPYQMPTIQLLRYAEGEVALRFCPYSLDGHFRPGLRALRRRLVE